MKTNLGKKIASFILVATAAACSLAMVGCNGGYREHRHEFVYVYNNDATCGEDGTKTGKCKYCDKTETTIEMGSATGKHEYDGYKCIVCGDYSPDAPVTEGLEFISFGFEYWVKGIGSCTSSEIMIPDKHNGLPVTLIDDSAFENCDFITKVIIPPTVTSIDRDAFSRCDNLQEVVIPDKVRHIERYAFGECKSLTTVTIPESVTTIESYVFSGCSSLASIVIPNTVTTIKEGAFNRCFGLTNVVIPNSVTKIESKAFAYCYNLESIYIRNSVTVMEKEVFYECNKLSVLCEAPSKPAGWDSEWNCIYNDEEKDIKSHCPVTWGHTA